MLSSPKWMMPYICLFVWEASITILPPKEGKILTILMLLKWFFSVRILKFFCKIFFFFLLLSVSGILPSSVKIEFTCFNLYLIFYCYFVLKGMNLIFYSYWIQLTTVVRCTKPTTPVRIAFLLLEPDAEPHLPVWRFSRVCLETLCPRLISILILTFFLFFWSLSYPATCLHVGCHTCANLEWISCVISWFFGPSL